MTGHTVFVTCADGPLAGVRMRISLSNERLGAKVGWCEVQPGGAVVTNYKLRADRRAAAVAL